jgi:hypothetical protein
MFVSEKSCLRMRSEVGRQLEKAGGFDELNLTNHEPESKPIARRKHGHAKAQST